MAQNSRHEPERTIDQKREKCEADIVRFLRNVNGPAAFDELVAVYHLHYRSNQGRRRYERVSEFLMGMEDSGLIQCTYQKGGRVIEARLKS